MTNKQHQLLIKELWYNIQNIYLKIGKDYWFDYQGLNVVSKDNGYDVEVMIDGEKHRFMIFIFYSLTSELSFKFFSNDRSVDFYLEKLKPIFRDFKLQEIINKKELEDKIGIKMVL